MFADFLRTELLQTGLCFPENFFEVCRCRIEDPRDVLQELSDWCCNPLLQESRSTDAKVVSESNQIKSQRQIGESQDLISEKLRPQW